MSDLVERTSVAGRAGAAPAGAVRGRVLRFDADSGVGEVAAGDGPGIFFHCTQLAGGSRTIEAGTEVSFTVVPGRLGRHEAAGVTPIAASGPSSPQIPGSGREPGQERP